MRDVNRVGFLLSAAVTLVFFALVSMMAFRPNLLTGSRGLLATLGFIVLTLVVMGGYSYWRIGRPDD